MQEDKNNTASDKSATIINGRKVIQPTTEFVQEQQSQEQQPQQPPLQTTSANPEILQTSKIPQSVYPQPDQISDNQIETVKSVNQMDLSQQKEDSKSNIKRRLLMGFVGLVIVGGIFMVLVYSNNISFSKFKTVHYYNGKGGNYSLEFYSRYSTKTVKDNLPISSDIDVSKELTELASKVSVNGKIPLTMWILTTPNVTENTNRGPYVNNDCSKSGMSKAFDAKVDFINSNVAICAIKQKDVEVIYFATFHSQQDGYIVYFAQDVDFSKLLSSPENARDGLSKIGLQDYQDDIKTILASIKPLN